MSQRLDHLLYHVVGLILHFTVCCILDRMGNEYAASVLQPQCPCLGVGRIAELR